MRAVVVDDDHEDLQALRIALSQTSIDEVKSLRTGVELKDWHMRGNRADIYVLDYYAGAGVTSEEIVDLLRDAGISLKAQVLFTSSSDIPLSPPNFIEKCSHQSWIQSVSRCVEHLRQRLLFRSDAKR